MAEVQNIPGIRQLGLRLKALPEEIAGKNGGPLLKALRRMGARIQKAAKDRVPVRSGALRDNIIVVRKDKRRLRRGEEGVDVTVRAKAKKYKESGRNRLAAQAGSKYLDYGPLFYARFIEFGTSKMQAKPFLRPAFEENKAAMGDIFRAELSRAIDEAVKKLAKRSL